MKALEMLKVLKIDIEKDIEAEGIEAFGYIDTTIEEVIKELEEHIKEDAYMLDKIEQSLSMGAKAQSLAIIEVYQILKNRNKA